MPGAFQPVDMDSVISCEALQLTVLALPDPAILADNKAPMSWEGWYQVTFPTASCHPPFFIPHPPPPFPHQGLTEYMPGAFKAVDMDSADPSKALHFTVPALPDLAILADNKAHMSWEDWYLVSNPPPPSPPIRLRSVHAWRLSACGHGLSHFL